MELLDMRLEFGQRGGGPPCTPVNAISVGCTGMPQRADLNPTELDFDEEKFITLDAVQCTGARRVPRTRSKALRIIIPRPSLTQTSKPV